MLKNRFLAYGSLKTNKYNHDAFDMTLIKKVEKLEGFQMYSLGSYPAIKNDPDGVIEELEILEVNSESDWRAIVNMELGAGYEMQTVIIDGEEMPIFVHKHNLNGFPKILKY